MATSITLHSWQHTDPRTGKRRRKCYRLSEVDVLSRLLDPERIDYDALIVGLAATTLGGHWRSGLVVDADEEGGGAT